MSLRTIVAQPDAGWSGRVGVAAERNGALETIPAEFVVECLGQGHAPANANEFREFAKRIPSPIVGELFEGLEPASRAWA